MFSTALKLAIRNFRRSLLYSSVNIIGLIVGLTCFLLVSFYAWHEFNYDVAYPESESIYRIDFVNADGKEFAISPSALATHLSSELPEVKKTVRINKPYGDQNPALVQVGDRHFYEHSIILADSSFLDVFEIQFISGSRSAVHDANTIIISESAAKKLFGSEDAIGKEIKINTRNELMVGGVYKDFPSNTHLRYDFIMPLHRNANLVYQWQFWDVQTYVLLHGNATASELSAKVKNLIRRHSGNSWLDSWNGFTFRLLPIPLIHFSPDINFDTSTPTSKTKVITIWLIGFSILLLSVGNFVSLIVARMMERMKEVALVKAMGAYRRPLVYQYFGETLLICSCAAVASAPFIWSVFPLFERITLTTYEVTNQVIAWFGMGLLLTTLIVALLASFYPLMVIFAIKPGETLRSQSSIRAVKEGPRKALVIFQCTTLSFLLACAFIINEQLELLLESNPGFDKEQVLLIRMRNLTATQQESLKTNVLQFSGVEQAGRASSPLGSRLGLWGFASESIPANDPRRIIHFLYVDKDFLSAMGIMLSQGQGFKTEINRENERLLIVNEALVKSLEIKEPVGHLLNTVEMQGTIIGVTSDFNFRSMEQNTLPLVLSTGSFNPVDTRQAPYEFLAVKTKTGDVNSVIEWSEDAWKKLVGEQPFEYFFQDEYFNRMHQKQTEFRNLLYYCTVLAVLIGAFGLFAFTSYLCKHKMREIGIRKVLGATILQVIWTISLKSLRLVIIGIILALPLAAYTGNIWLQGQAFHIQLTILPFLIVGGTVVVFSGVVILTEAVKASLSNPVKVLRSE